MSDSLKRSLVKAFSWRFFGTIDTFLLSFFVIKWLAPLLGSEVFDENPTIAAAAASIAVAEVVTKIIIYTLHEQAWGRVAWGRISEGKTFVDTKVRSLSKTGTWRILASADTALLAWLFTGSIAAALSIGSLEVLTKLVLYFFHERLWAIIPIR